MSAQRYFTLWTLTARESRNFLKASPEILVSKDLYIAKLVFVLALHFATRAE